MNKELKQLKEENDYIDRVVDEESTLEELQVLELEELISQEDFLADIDEYPEVEFQQDVFPDCYAEYYSDAEREDWV